MNLFLYKNNALISKNYILAKSWYYSLIRFGICHNDASGRRGRTATTRHATTVIKIYMIAGHEKKSAVLIELASTYSYLCIHVMHPRWAPARWSIQCMVGKK